MRIILIACFALLIAGAAQADPTAAELDAYKQLLSEANGRLASLAGQLQAKSAEVERADTALKEALKTAKSCEGKK